LFNIIGRQLPALLFAILFGPAIAGMYALSHRVLSLPSRLVGQAIGDVFLSSASASLRRDNLGLLVAKVHERLAHIAMAPTLVLVLAGPELFALVFGSNWELAGKFAQWLAPFLYMTFVTSPLTRVFSVLEKQVHEVAFQGALLVIRFSGLLIGAWIGEPLIAVALFAIGSAFCYMLFLWWIVVVAGIPWAKFRHAMLTAFGWSIMLTSPLILVKLIGLDTMFLFIALAVTGVAIVARDLAMVLESNQSQA
jgi:O-antigen/teichoic acid export membrane protein